MKRFVTLMVVGVFALAFAGEEKIKLKDGKGKELVEANCSVCHSLIENILEPYTFPFCITHSSIAPFYTRHIGLH